MVASRVCSTDLSILRRFHRFGDRGCGIRRAAWPEAYPTSYQRGKPSILRTSSTMSFIKRSELLAFANSPSVKNFVQAQASQIREARLKQVGSISSVFLSHSHLDKDLVQPAVTFLKNQGVEVYVDWLDGEMPPRVSGETARKLKEKIGQHDRFIVLVTEQSKDSHWVPWELGIADGEKGIPKIATFPIRSEDREFVGNEYFSIYPRIEKVNDTWYVWLSDPVNLRSLRDWLRVV